MAEVVGHVQVVIGFHIDAVARCRLKPQHIV